MKIQERISNIDKFWYSATIFYDAEKNTLAIVESPSWARLLSIANPEATIVKTGYPKKDYTELEAILGNKPKVSYI